jgi:hypothetical protein
MRLAPHSIDRLKSTAFRADEKFIAGHSHGDATTEKFLI